MIFLFSIFLHCMSFSEEKNCSAVIPGPEKNAKFPPTIPFPLFFK